MLLAYFILCLSPIGICEARQPTPKGAEVSAKELQLTPEELRYVAQNPEVIMCTDPDWEPFERIDEQGKHVGIAADLLALVSHHTGLRFTLLKTATWEESLAASKNGACDILSFLNDSGERRKWLDFTEPLLKDPNVFITREEHPFIADPENIFGETIALPIGTSVAERIQKEYPRLRVMETASEAEAIELVSNRKADMTLRSLIVAAYTIRKEGHFNLKISGQIPEYTNFLRIGVRKDKPLLRDILDKGVRAITPQEREAIINRQVAITVQMGVDRVLIFKVILGSLLVLSIGLYWTMRLRHLNKQLKHLAQTDVLTGLLNRSALNAKLAVELERAQRYASPFSVLLLDIDHFKNVNDHFGHLIGDKVLIGIAQTAAKNIRGIDSLGRWGGEEFLILCPETSAAQAHIVAERVRAGVEAASFPTGTSQTISIGLATASTSDSIDSLLGRADIALYEAKNNGRNQVRSA